MELNILLCGVVILMCILSGRFTDKYGVPSILLFILIGMLFGVEGILKISFSDFALSEKICTTALIFIMFYGGFGTSWKMAKPILPKAVLLSTAGVVLTAGLCTLFSLWCVEIIAGNQSASGCGDQFHRCSVCLFHSSFQKSELEIRNSIHSGGGERK